MNIQPGKPAARRGALASSTADLRELKNNSRATVQELQAFLRELKGRSPQEMLGVVTSSQLVRSIGLAAILVTGGIFLFTAIPFFLADAEIEKPINPEPAPVLPAPAAPVAAPTEPAPDPLSNLGVGEELKAPPDENPLENKSDDFLKDLE